MEAVCKQAIKLSKFKEKDHPFWDHHLFVIHLQGIANVAATMKSCLWSLSFLVVTLRRSIYLLLWGNAIHRSNTMYPGVYLWDVPKPADIGFIFYFIQFSSLLYQGCISISITSLAEVYNLTIENASQSLWLGTDLLGLLNSLFLNL